MDCALPGYSDVALSTFIVRTAYWATCSESPGSTWPRAHLSYNFGDTSPRLYRLQKHYLLKLLQRRYLLLNVSLSTAPHNKALSYS